MNISWWISVLCAPSQFAPCSCHVQSLSSATASVTCVATHVWRWLSWHHKEANIFLTRPHAPPWKFDNAGHLLFRCFLELEEGYMFCLGLFNNICQNLNLNAIKSTDRKTCTWIRRLKTVIQKKNCKEVIFRPYVCYVLLLSWIV